MADSGATEADMQRLQGQCDALEICLRLMIQHLTERDASFHQVLETMQAEVERIQKGPQMNPDSIRTISAVNTFANILPPGVGGRPGRAKR